MPNSKQFSEDHQIFSPKSLTDGKHWDPDFGMVKSALLTPGEIHVVADFLVEIIETSFGLRKIGEKPGEIPILCIFCSLTFQFLMVKSPGEKHQFASRLGSTPRISFVISRNGREEAHPGHGSIDLEDSSISTLFNGKTMVSCT